jgi:hypothetical protein
MWERDLKKIESGAGATSKILIKWTLIFVPALLVLLIIGFVLHSMGLIGSTVVERKVFENSFQYSEARKTAIATYEAQLAEINRKLASDDLNSQTKTNLESQAAAIRIQLSTERSKQ